MHGPLPAGHGRHHSLNWRNRILQTHATQRRHGNRAHITQRQATPVAILEREWLLETLDALVSDATRGNGSIVFLSGEAGAGKTTVVRALLDGLPHDALALVGACDSIPDPAQLWPLRDLAEHAGPALREPVLTGGSREALFRGTLA